MNKQELPGGMIIFHEFDLLGKAQHPSKTKKLHQHLLLKTFTFLVIGYH